MRVAVVGPAGPTTSSRTGSTGPDVVDERGCGNRHRAAAVRRFANRSAMRLCAASRPVSILPLSSSRSPGFQLAISSRVTVSRLTRRASAAPASSRTSASRTRFGGSKLAGPDAVERRSARGASPRSSGSSRQAATRRASDSRGSSRRARSSARRGPARRCRARSPRRRARCAALRSWIGPRAFSSVHVDGIHQRFLGQQHRLLGRAADADARACPADTSPRPSSARSSAPSRRGIGRIEHRELRLVLRAAAFGRQRDLDRVAGRRAACG